MEINQYAEFLEAVVRRNLNSFTGEDFRIARIDLDVPGRDFVKMTIANTNIFNSTDVIIERYNGDSETRISLFVRTPAVVNGANGSEAKLAYSKTVSDLSDNTILYDIAKNITVEHLKNCTLQSEGEGVRFMLAVLSAAETTNVSERLTTKYQSFKHITSDGEYPVTELKIASKHSSMAILIVGGQTRGKIIWSLKGENPEVYLQLRKDFIKDSISGIAGTQLMDWVRSEEGPEALFTRISKALYEADELLANQEQRCDIE